LIGSPSQPARQGTRITPLIAAALIASLALLTGCNSGAKQKDADTTSDGATSSAQALQRLIADAEAEADKPGGDFDATLAPPAILAEYDVRLRPHTGPAAQKAKLPYHELIDALPKPDFLTRPADTPDAGEGDDASDEPPAAALRAYALGRAAFLDGQRWEAINQLEQAHRLDPRSAHILRLLGHIYFAFGNSVKGAQRLTEAVQLDPRDAESLFLLGRFDSQKGRWNDAVVLLDAATRIDDARVDPAVRYLLPYYLGRALLELGHDAAAVEQLNAYLDLPRRFNRTTRLHQELALLARQRDRVRLSVADALCRIGRFHAALEHYDAVAQFEDEAIDDAELLTARLVYANLAIGRPRSAELALVRQLQQSADSPKALTLVGYVANHGAARQRFVGLLRALYDEADQPPSLAIAVAALLPDADAAALLVRHLRGHAADLPVYRAMIARLAADQPALLISSVIDVAAAHPHRAARYAEALRTMDVSAEALLQHFDELAPARRSSAAGSYVRGALEESAQRFDDATAAYERALAADPSFSSAELALITLRVRAGQFEEALTLIDRVGETEDAAVLRAKVRAYIGLERFDEAMTVINALIERDPDDVEFALLRGDLLHRQRDYDKAEATLLQLLRRRPADERIYIALFDLYEDDDNTRHDAAQWRRLQLEAKRNIPSSRIARLKTAEWHQARHEFDVAESELRDILRDDPDDREALELLVRVYARAGDLRKAESFLHELIARRPDDRAPIDLLEIVVDALQDDHSLKRFYEVKLAFLSAQPKSAAAMLELAGIYVALDQPDRAIEAINQALALGPQFTADLHLMLAELYVQVENYDDAIRHTDLAIAEKADRTADLYYFKARIHQLDEDAEAGEQALLAALKADPKHAPSNNDLGYQWAEANKNLDQALEMTRIAVQQVPDNSAYLDSLGWVHYKRGEFREAVLHLRAARTKERGDDPVILDHLGDALWRFGQKTQAVSYWKAALRKIEAVAAEPRDDLVELRPTVESKIRAAEADADPPVAPLPSEPDLGANRPPDDHTPDADAIAPPPADALNRVRAIERQIERGAPVNRLVAP